MNADTNLNHAPILNALYLGLEEDTRLDVQLNGGGRASIETAAELDRLVARGSAAALMPSANGTVAFLYFHSSDVAQDAWQDLPLRPSLVLTKAREQICCYALAPALSSAAVAALALAMECDMSAGIPLPGPSGWAAAHVGDATYEIAELEDAFLPNSCASGVGGTRKDEDPNDCGTLLDARLLTPIDLEEPTYAQEMIISVGSGRESTNWKPQKMPVAQFIALLAQHKEDPRKDGLAFVMAEIRGPARKKVAVAKCYGVGLDIDVGTPSARIDEALLKLGVAAVRYTTHSHAKTRTEFSKDRLVKWAADGGMSLEDPEAIRAFLTTKEHWDLSIAETAHYIGDEHTAEGLKAYITHAPMPKHRVVVPLAEAFDTTAVAATHDEGMKKWADVCRGLAAALGDLPLDRSALDPSRLFYFPRHANGRAHETTIFGGPLLDWKDLKLSTPPALTSGLSAVDRKWAATRADGFQLADLIRDEAPDRIRQDKVSKLEIECPFDAEHSNPGDPADRACMVVNAGDGSASGFTVTCRHEACSGRDRLDFLKQMIADDWFPAGAVTGDEYDAVERERQDEMSLPPTEFAVPGDEWLSAKFPLPVTHGTFAYQEFDGRQWIFEQAGDSDGKGKWRRLFTPFTIRGGVAFADRDGQRGLRVDLLDEGGATVPVDLPAGLAMRAGGADLKTRLRELGVLMTDDGERRLVQLFKQVQPPHPVTVYDRPGWRDGVFVTPWGRSIGSNRPVELHGPNLPSGPEVAGTLDGWREATRVAVESDVLHFQVGLLAGFVSPIIDLCQLPSVWLAFTGSTSKGKSTAHKLQAAVWGDPSAKRGLFGSFNGTANASEALLQGASGAGYAFDEHKMIDGRELQSLIFRGAGGGGADRLNRDASLKKARRWSLMATLSGETSLFQKITSAGDSATTGLGPRCLDINVEDAAQMDRPTMERIEAAFHHHGHAGPAFVSALFDLRYVEAPERLASEVAELAELLAGEGDPVLRRAAMIAALIWKAGEISLRAGLLPEDFDSERLARRLWAKALESDTAPASAPGVAIRTLFEYLIRHRGVGVAEHTPVSEGELLSNTHRPLDASRLPNLKELGPVYVVPVSELAKRAGGGLDQRAIISALKRHGALHPNPRADRPAWTWDYVPGFGNLRAVVIKAEAVEAESSAEAV